MGVDRALSFRQGHPHLRGCRAGLTRACPLRSVSRRTSERARQRGTSGKTGMSRPVCLVIDDFLDDPDAIRRVALAQRFVKMHSAGLRTVESFLHLFPYRQAFERALGCRLTNFDDNAANGRFQLCTAADAIPYHSDSQSYAGVLFLTPDAPIDAGVSF